MKIFPITLSLRKQSREGCEMLSAWISKKALEKKACPDDVMVCCAPTFYGWVFQWGGKFRITAPKEAVQEYAAMAKEALSALENK